MRIRLILSILAWAILFTGIANANTDGDFRDWEALKKKELLARLTHDFSSEPFLKEYPYTFQELELLFQDLKFNLSLIEKKKKGRRRTLEERKARYGRIFLHEKGYKLGREYLELHKEALEKAEKQDGVPKEIIVAILWIETSFGKNTGHSYAFKSLYNLYMRKLIRYEEKEPAKMEEYRLHLAYFLALCRQKGLEPKKVLGSYAGALGIPQFMPYSWRYGVDANGDGEVDLFNNHDDAIFSVANYLKKHGWSRDSERALLRYNYDSAYTHTVRAFAKKIKEQKDKK